MNNGTMKHLNQNRMEEIEEIEEAAKEFAKNYSIYPTAQDDTEYGFKHGAKWMLDKLKDFDTWKEWKD